VAGIKPRLIEINEIVRIGKERLPCTKGAQEENLVVYLFDNQNIKIRCLQVFLQRHLRGRAFCDSKKLKLK
jgi:hypothetical protein